MKPVSNHLYVIKKSQSTGYVLKHSYCNYDRLLLSPLYYKLITLIWCSANYVSGIHAKISDDMTHPVPYYNPRFYTAEDSGTTHLSVLSPDGDAVSVTSLVQACKWIPVRGVATTSQPWAGLGKGLFFPPVTTWTTPGYVPAYVQLWCRSCLPATELLTCILALA